MCRQGFCYANDDHVMKPMPPPHSQGENKDIDELSGNYAKEEDIGGFNHGAVVSNPKDPTTEPMISETAPLIADQNLPQKPINELVKTPPSKKPSIRPLPFFPADGVPLPVSVDHCLQELQSCIGQPPTTFGEITRRQHLVRDLRLDPALYNWSIFGIAPGPSPRDVRAPLVSMELVDDSDDLVGKKSEL